MKAHTLENLIAEYLEQVKKATDLLEYSCGTKNILRLWRIQKKPRCGMVIGDVTYELHGIGCCVYLSGMALTEGSTASTHGVCTYTHVSCRKDTKNTPAKRLWIMNSTST